jgi:hypothetical protein
MGFYSHAFCFQKGTKIQIHDAKYAKQRDAPPNDENNQCEKAQNARQKERGVRREAKRMKFNRKIREIHEPITAEMPRTPRQNKLKWDADGTHPYPK